MDRVSDTEIVKWIRELLPVLVILVILTSAVEAYFIRDNSNQLNALVTQNQILQANQAQQGAAFEVFLKGFNAENNYECRVLWYLNTHDVNVPVAPPISICSVVAP